MNTNCTLKIVIISICILLMTGSQPSGRTESSTNQADALRAFSTTGNLYQESEEGTGDKEPEQEPDRPRGRMSISVATDLVTLQVLVTDEKGNVVTGLRPENFTVYEDDVKQEITNFAPIEANVTVVMLVEYRKYGDYGVDNMFIQQIYNISEHFARNLRKGDWVGVMGYDMKPMILTDFTQNKIEFLSAVRALAFPAMSEHNLFDALMDVFDRTEEMDGKVAILLLSTGLNSFSKYTYEQVLDRCQRTTATVYAISLGQYFRVLYGEETAAYYLGVAGGLPLSPIDLSMADTRLKYFAEYTGGNAYFPRHDSEMPAIVNNISALLRSQYSLGYASTNTKKDGKFRKIKVEVADVVINGKKLKLKAKTRKGYKAHEL